ncbi:MAG: hypothetical protein LBB48_05230, partial [Treponema sp.]|nr:hypothetical protein [Treponema sp.]
MKQNIHAVYAAIHGDHAAVRQRLLRAMCTSGLKLSFFSICVAAAFARPAPEQSLVIPAFQEPWLPVALLSDQTVKVFERASDGFQDIKYEPLLVTSRSMENGKFYLYVCNAVVPDTGSYAALVYLYQRDSDGDIRIADIQAIGHLGTMGSYRAFEKPVPEVEASLQEALVDNAEIVSVAPLLAATQ